MLPLGFLGCGSIGQICLAVLCRLVGRRCVYCAPSTSRRPSSRENSRRRRKRHPNLRQQQQQQQQQTDHSNTETDTEMTASKDIFLTPILFSISMCYICTLCIFMLLVFNCGCVHVLLGSLLVICIICISMRCIHVCVCRSSASKKAKLDLPAPPDASSSPQFLSSLTRYSIPPPPPSLSLFLLEPSILSLLLYSCVYRDSQPIDLISSNHLMETDRLYSEVRTYTYTIMSSTICT